VDITEASGFVSYDSILLRHATPARRVYVLFHGLTASPRQFETFGRLLFDRGADVFIPRLPHHGYGDRLTSALRNLTADELRAFAEESYARACTFGGSVRAVGFSVGGLLAAWLGQRRPLERATAISPFLGVSWIPHGLTARAARFALRVPNRFVWWDPILRERLMPEHGYPRFPTHAVAVSAQLGQELLRDAAERAPAAHDVQIVLNTSEAAVNNSAATALARSWARSTRQRIVLHRVKGLPASHDIIEPMRHSAIVRHVYPALLDLVDR
jgi:alpha-beta hydrolase superfamily lysophospholipase